MPKVTDEYLADKRNYILECTGEILKEKPLYLITMRDIIKKAGFSQGVIYRYYSGLDEIYIDFVNQHTVNDILEQRIDALLDSGQSEKAILSDCIVTIGEYMEELLESVGGKTFFELIVYYSYDLEKRALVSPRLKFQQSLEYAQNKIMDYALANVDRGVFKPMIPVGSIIMFVISFIDGIALSLATNAAGETERNFGMAIHVPELFRTLAAAIIGFLEV